MTIWLGEDLTLLIYLKYCHREFYEFRRDGASIFYEYRSMPPRSKPSSSLFGLRLREARLLAGIPQDKLGVAIGLDETTASARISRYETGVHAPPFEIAAQLAMVLNVPTPFLYCEDDELAAVIQAWHQLSNIERARLLTLLRMKQD